MLPFIISENNMSQPCLSLAGCVFPHTEASLKSTTQKDTSENKLGNIKET